MGVPSDTIICTLPACEVILLSMTPGASGYSDDAEVVRATDGVVGWYGGGGVEEEGEE